MKLSYYYQSGRYGDHYDATKDYTNLVRISRSGVYGDPRGEIPAALLELKRAVADGKDIQLALDINSPNVGPSGWKPFLKAVLREQGAAERIVAIELRDEPNWSDDEIHSKAAAVRKLLGDELIETPLGVTLSPDDVIAGKAEHYWDAGLDYLAAEAYLPLGLEWDPSAALDESYRLVKKLRRKTPRNLSLWIVGQSYDRNGAFGPAKALKAVQHGTYKGAKEVGAEGIVWFSYGRPGGVETYPGLAREHRAIARAEGILRG